jgi:hypothetical protein
MSNVNAVDKIKRFDALWQGGGNDECYIGRGYALRRAEDERLRFFVVEQRAEIAHIEPTAACFAFPKMLGLTQWRSANSLAHNRPARDRPRHARDLGYFLPSPPGLIGISILS